MPEQNHCNPRRRLLALALAPLWLAACASLAPMAPEASSPQRSGPPVSAASPTAGAAASIAWWSALGDPVLSQLVGETLTANPDIASALASFAQARAQADVQRAGQGPQLGTSASVQRSQTGRGDPGNRFQWGIDASW